MSVLAKIVDRKKERLSTEKVRVPITELRAMAQDVQGPLDFKRALKRRGGSVRLIAEVKKSSPSKGLVRMNFDHKKIASVYREKKVDAISVLTEEDFFQGSLGFLADVKNIAELPVLRKDFIIDEYQIVEARAYHADAVLLIAAILDDVQAGEYLHMAKELGMAVLFEVHDRSELEMAFEIDAPIIGINNRNLTTLKIDLSTTFDLKQYISADKIVVSESGIRSRDDVVKLENAGIDAMLIGTTLMESKDIGKKIDELRGTE